MSSKNYDDELDVLMSFLAESVAQMNDSQIEEEYGSGRKSRAKEVLKGELRELHKQKLRAARTQYESAAKGLSSRSYGLPASSSDRRILLSNILSQRPELRSLALTAQHRDLKSLADSDIESFLRQLAELGLLDRFLEEK